MAADEFCMKLSVVPPGFPIGKVPTCGPLLAVMKAPMESLVPGWFAPDALLRPRVLPMKVTAPFVVALNRLQYPDVGHITVCARAAVATAIVTMNATAAVRR